MAAKLVRLGIVLALLALAALLAWRWVTGWAPPREQYAVQGVAASEAQGEIAWHSVAAAGADFAYLRATRGAEARDSAFASNREAARNAGLRHGAVHHFSLCRLASDQAANFVTTVPRDPDALPPAVRLAFAGDCDERPSRSLVLSELGTFLNQIEAHAEKPALLAIGKDFEELYAPSGAIDRTVWLEGDFFPPDYAAKPWVMWTANSGRHVAGIDGPVDWVVVRP